MARLGKACPGDCSKCEMLRDGEVDMIPCILDQLFQRQQWHEKMLDEILKHSQNLEEDMKVMPQLVLTGYSSMQDNADDEQPVNSSTKK